MPKFAIFAQPQKTDMGRAMHSLLYAKQLHDAGHDVAVYYDGEGTTWIPRFEDPAFPYHQLFNEVNAAGLIVGACRYCANAFGVAEAVERSSIAFVDDDQGHPSIAKAVTDGRTVVTL